MLLRTTIPAEANTNVAALLASLQTQTLVTPSCPYLLSDTQPLRMLDGGFQLSDFCQGQAVRVRVWILVLLGVPGGGIVNDGVWFDLPLWS